MLDKDKILNIECYNTYEWESLMDILERMGYKWHNCDDCNKMHGIEFDDDENLSDRYNVIRLHTKDKKNLVIRDTRKSAVSSISYNNFFNKYISGNRKLCPLEFARNIIYDD